MDLGEWDRYGGTRYATPTGISFVDGLSTGPPGFGVSQLGIRA